MSRRDDDEGELLLKRDSHGWEDMSYQHGSRSGSLNAQQQGLNGRVNIVKIWHRFCSGHISFSIYVTIHSKTDGSVGAVTSHTHPKGMFVKPMKKVDDSTESEVFLYGVINKNEGCFVVEKQHAADAAVGKFKTVVIRHFYKNHGKNVCVVVKIDGTAERGLLLTVENCDTTQSHKFPNPLSDYDRRTSRPLLRQWTIINPDPGVLSQQSSQRKFLDIMADQSLSPPRGDRSLSS